MNFWKCCVPKSFNINRRDHWITPGAGLISLQIGITQGWAGAECGLPIRHSRSITIAANFQSFSTLPASSSSRILSVITYTNNTKYFYNLDNIFTTLISLRMRLSSLCMGWAGTVFSSDTGGWGSEMLGWWGWTTTVLTMHSGHNTSIIIWIVRLHHFYPLGQLSSYEAEEKVHF